MLEIVQIPVLSDNYVYLIHDSKNNLTAVVDPAKSEPVIATLKEKNWELTHIFNTHHHWDHTGGNAALKERYQCTILGSAYDAERIPGIDTKLSDQENFHFGSETIQVLYTPGHTTGHICFYLENSKALFCGDTLFSIGCGRLFEGTAQDMLASMKKIQFLPKETRIYCAHEYTESNGNFALSIEPNNLKLRKYMDEVREKRANDLPTIPSTLSLELEVNPFLRWDSKEIQNNIQLEQTKEWEVFQKIRALKDGF